LRAFPHFRDHHFRVASHRGLVTQQDVAKIPECGLIGKRFDWQWASLPRFRTNPNPTEISSLSY
jgi:hypothetical protein